MSPSIIFDFDGTLAVGDGPVLAYARYVAPAAAPDYLERVESALKDFATGASEYRDGYDVVGSLAIADGVSAQTMSAAYMNSRELLATSEAPVTTVADLRDFLGTLAGNARLHLATNAPGTGVDRALEQWGVRDLFTALHFNVGKPDGLVPILTEALRTGPVLAVGDIVAFDLAPAIELGADTVLVGATAHASTAPVTLRAASLNDLKNDITAWAANAASGSHEHSPAELPKGNHHA